MSFSEFLTVGILALSVSKQKVTKRKNDVFSFVHREVRNCLMIFLKNNYVGKSHENTYRYCITKHYTMVFDVEGGSKC